MIFEPRAAAIIYNILRAYEEDKVFILPSNVCPIVPITFLKANKRFELIDISDESLCIDEEIVLTRLKQSPNKYAGVLFVRTFGTDDCFETFFKQIKDIQESFLVIDDRCLSIPNTDYIETYADVVLYSTGYSKVVDLGYGGIAQLKGNVNYKKYPNKYSEKSHSELINNYKFSIQDRSQYIYKDSNWLDNSISDRSFESHVELMQMEYNESIRIKKRINKIYSDNLPSNIQLKPNYQLWRFNITVPNNSNVIDVLFANNLFASTHYPSLNGIFCEGDAINTEKLHSTVINLFNDKHYSEEKAYMTVDIINQFV